MRKKDKIEDEIKNLNAIRAMYHRDLEEFEKKYKDNEMSKEEFEKHKINYDKKREGFWITKNPILFLTKINEIFNYIVL